MLERGLSWWFMAELHAIELHLRIHCLQYLSSHHSREASYLLT